MLKRKSAWLVAISLVLAACGSQAEELEADRQAAKEQKERLVTALNEIQEQEMALQANFNEGLAADPEMASFYDGSAPVFVNIDSREEQLLQVKEAQQELQKLREELGEYDEEELPREQVAALQDTIAEIISLLEGYVPAYEEQLAQERDIFRSFGEEQADFNTFYTGLDTLNGESDANLATLQPLREVLKQFDQQAEKIAAQLEELQEE